VRSHAHAHPCLPVVGPGVHELLLLNATTLSFGASSLSPPRLRSSSTLLLSFHAHPSGCATRTPIGTRRRWNGYYCPLLMRRCRACCSRPLLPLPQDPIAVVRRGVGKKAARLREAPERNSNSAVDYLWWEIFRSFDLSIFLFLISVSLFFLRSGRLGSFLCRSVLFHLV